MLSSSGFHFTQALHEWFRQSLRQLIAHERGRRCFMVHEMAGQQPQGPIESFFSSAKIRIIGSSVVLSSGMAAAPFECSR